MRVLVTGGAGYIGSHTVVQLALTGHDVVVVDNLSNSKASVRPRLEALIGQPIRWHVVDVTDREGLDEVFAAEPIDAVIHFAGFKAVGESVAKPRLYYENNLGSTFALLDVMERHDCRTLVFSSSATVYGFDTVYGRNEPPYTEDMPTAAINPYGWTKVMIEQILRDVAYADPTWRIALLRYFNPVGAHPSGTIGEDPQGIPNNLVPFIAQVAVGRREKLAVFGDDYATADGTPLRDYIHVEDLAAGHLAALSRLGTTDEPVSAWNLGTGLGSSVFEVLHSFERAVGHEIPYVVESRRSGDLAVTYADPRRAQAELGWRAERSLDQMCADHWRWQSQNPQGYPEV